MESVPAPDGRFELRELINPGACPQCGEMSSKMWHYNPVDSEDRFASLTTIVISCEDCAMVGGK